jgi:hypothetical protein
VAGIKSLPHAFALFSLFDTTKINATATITSVTVTTTTTTTVTMPIHPFLFAIDFSEEVPQFNFPRGHRPARRPSPLRNAQTPGGETLLGEGCQGVFIPDLASFRSATGWTWSDDIDDREGDSDAGGLRDLQRPDDPWSGMRRCTTSSGVSWADMDEEGEEDDSGDGESLQHLGNSSDDESFLCPDPWGMRTCVTASGVCWADLDDEDG